MARPTLNLNRKFLKLAQRLQSRAHARGHLELLWDAAHETGNPTIGDIDDVEAVCDWRGPRGELVRALLECGTAGGGAGFIVETGDGRYEIHDYWDHAPDYVRKRLKREQVRRETGAELKAASDRSRVATDRSRGTNSRASDRSPPVRPSVGVLPTNNTDRSPAPGTAASDRSEPQKNEGLSITPTPAPAPARQEEEFTHTPRARGADRSADQTETNLTEATKGHAEVGVKYFGTTLCEIGDQALDEWRRSVPEVNPDAFARWIAHWERNKGKRMAAGVRLLQARDLGKRGDPTFQLALVEHCMRQDWGSLISNADYIRQTNGRGGTKTSAPPRKSLAELEVEDVWRRHRAGESETAIARESMVTVARVREILAGEEPKHAVG